jgi:hypothetical protein
MFILQYHVCKNKNKKELNLHTKGKKDPGAKVKFEG